MERERWLRLSEKAFPASEFGSNPRRAEAWVGPVPALFTDEDLDAFRRCTEHDARTFAELVEHPLHRHIVKLVVLATRHVPEWLTPALLRAACLTVNPSFNRHFVAPCLVCFGRRRVVSELIEIALGGSDDLKVGATNALFWSAIARENERWPDAKRYEPFDGPPDEPVDDLLEVFHLWAVEEFLSNDALDVRRVLVRPELRSGRAAERCERACWMRVLRSRSTMLIAGASTRELAWSPTVPAECAPLRRRARSRRLASAAHCGQDADQRDRLVYTAGLVVRGLSVKPRVYVETTVLSCLTELPSRDLVRAAHQQITSEWWASRDAFKLFVSDAVLEEMRLGDEEAARRRLSAAQGIAVLATTPDAQALARALLRDLALPAKAAIDAVHIAVAAVSAMDFLLTWNCTLRTR